MLYSLATAPRGRMYRVKGGHIHGVGAMEVLEIDRFASMQLHGTTLQEKFKPLASFISVDPNTVELESIEEEEERRFRAREDYHRAVFGKGQQGGADPEVFVEDGEGRVVPAWEFLPPKVEMKGIYWDGFQGEFTVQPSNCIQVQVDRIQNSLKTVWNRARQYKPDTRLSFKSVVEVSPEVLQSAKVEHVVLGCKPSLNAWGLEGMPVMDSRELGWRFAGGHVHYEHQGITPVQAERATRAVDKIAGIPSLLMFQKMDLPIRRQYYGLPGEYRKPAHGLEWRFLSNAWLCHPAIAHFTLNLTRLGIRAGLKELDGLWEGDGERVMRVLVEGDLDEARRMVRRNLGVYERVMKSGVKSAYEETFLTENSGDVDTVMKASLKALETPVGEFVPLESMENNWRFDKQWRIHCNAPACMWQTLVLGKTRDSMGAGAAPTPMMSSPVLAV